MTSINAQIIFAGLDPIEDLFYFRESNMMPTTITTTPVGQIIGGVFSNRVQADKAVEAFVALHIEQRNIQVVEHMSDEELKRAYTQILLERGVAHSQANFYDSELHPGKILVVIYEVQVPGPVIEIFDTYQARYNPDGSRNLRDDVVGMTTGAAAGAIMGGVLGGVLAGPVGAMIGVTGGAIFGGGTGATVGTIVEQDK